MKKILILGVASVQMDAIIHLKNLGYEVHACAMKKDGPGAVHADYFTEINILDKNSIIDYIKKFKIDLVYSVGSDIAIPISMQISKKLNMKRFVDENSAIICNNKNLMRECLGSKFLGNIEFQILENKNEELKIEYPFIMKPADSQGQRGVVLIENKKEFDKEFDISKSFSRSGIVIIEQYISGPEISVNGYMVNGNLEFLITSDRETWEKYTGLIHKHIVPSLEANEIIDIQVKDIVERACNKIGIKNGPVYLQMKLENNKPYIIEITPRLDGCHMWKLLKEYTGVNLLKLTFDHLLNDDISELKKFKINKNKEIVLEFKCQEPNTKARYNNSVKIKNILDSYNYYNEGDMIRAINGKYEKIGYIIY